MYSFYCGPADLSLVAFPVLGDCSIFAHVDMRKNKSREKPHGRHINMGQARQQKHNYNQTIVQCAMRVSDRMRKFLVLGCAQRQRLYSPASSVTCLATMPARLSRCCRRNVDVPGGRPTLEQCKQV